MDNLIDTVPLATTNLSLTMSTCPITLGFNNASKALEITKVNGVFATEVFSLTGDYIYGDMEELKLVSSDWRVVLMRMCGTWRSAYWACEQMLSMVREDIREPVGVSEFEAIFRFELRRLLIELHAMGCKTIEEVSKDVPHIKQMPRFIEFKTLTINNVIDFYTEADGTVDLKGFDNLGKLANYCLINLETKAKRPRGAPVKLTIIGPASKGKKPVSSSTLHKVCIQENKQLSDAFKEASRLLRASMAQEKALTSRIASLKQTVSAQETVIKSRNAVCGMQQTQIDCLKKTIIQHRDTFQLKEAHFLEERAFHRKLMDKLAKKGLMYKRANESYKGYIADAYRIKEEKDQRIEELEQQLDTGSYDSQYSKNLAVRMIELESSLLRSQEEAKQLRSVLTEYEFAKELTRIQAQQIVSMRAGLLDLYNGSGMSFNV